MNDEESKNWKEIRFEGKTMKEAVERFHAWFRIAAAEEIQDQESVQVHQIVVPDGFVLLIRYRSARRRP